ncbi:tektin-like protein 1 isoform X1 [Hydra vulgaris]|uniref:tektin-like protein 1 isoform X1 n=1 Tax=Hydra vulgaris TaxID=6087 RepID=UPI000640E9C0|nr:coiled-coil domain-containing protein 105 [Hydra vulgaris]XP_047134329.1 coiled-coil domain-containing protein 105 [Hydra vulgaris]
MEVTTSPKNSNELTEKNIKLAQSAIVQSNKLKCLKNRYNSSALPSLNEDSIEVKKYFNRIQADIRSTKSIISKLTDTLLNVDEEIKSLLKLQDNVEKVLDHIRRDLLLNEKSIKIRKLRPQNEKDRDAADDFLLSEKSILLQIKKLSEFQLRSIQIQLQVLSNARKILNNVVSECKHSLNIISHGETLLGFPNKSTQKTSCNIVTYSGINNVGAYISEATQAISMSYDAIKSSRQLKSTVVIKMKEVTALQNGIHSNVNEFLMKKVAESESTKKRLQCWNGENLIALHHDSRCQFITDIARGRSLGPVNYTDLTLSERSCPIHRNRTIPLLPETRLLNEKNAALEKYFDAISKNVEMLKLTQQRLKNDISDKRAAIQVDASVVRYRRQKNNHWNDTSFL